MDFAISGKKQFTLGTSIVYARVDPYGSVNVSVRQFNQLIDQICSGFEKIFLPLFTSELNPNAIYICLCICRLKEGNRALSQALQLGLADASLLREIGNCYVAAGRLEAAEGVLRMSLAADGNGTGGNPHTRRRVPLKRQGGAGGRGGGWRMNSQSS